MPVVRRVVRALVSVALLTAGTFAAADSKPGKPAGTLSGQVRSTQNPQVARYTIKPPSTGTWFVSFGPTAAYGRTTSVQTIASPGQAVSMYVAGMLPETTYHMQASVILADGTTLLDQDRTFTTGPLPPGVQSFLPVTRGAGTPQPGIELIDNINVDPSRLIATDLDGNVIWTYTSGSPHDGPELYPGKLLPNGDFLCYLAPNSYPVDQSGSNWLREFDLAGNTVRELPLQKLSAALSRLGFQYKLATFSHDFAVLPNGHLLVIANESRSLTDLVGYPGTTDVVGDVVIDLDPSWTPVWYWDEFDHLDVNRHLMSFPDWTHTNSVAYSPDDGNFIVSIRHQNWIVKVDYRNGQGTGNILWRLGQGGDFTLRGGVDPVDWFYAQHDAEFAGPRSAGLFTLSIMDNGDDRNMDPNSCGVGPEPPCLYSTVQLLQVDEQAKTATLQFHQLLPDYLYSGWGGSVEVLANGDIEYALSAPSIGSQIFEVTNSAVPQTVWQLSVPANSAYRGSRMPSLYPGVQW